MAGTGLLRVNKDDPLENKLLDYEALLGKAESLLKLMS